MPAVAPCAMAGSLTFRRRSLRDRFDSRNQVIPGERSNEVGGPFARRRSVTKADDSNARVIALQPFRNHSRTAFRQTLLDHEHIEGNGPKRRQDGMAAVGCDAHREAGGREDPRRHSLQITIFQDEEDRRRRRAGLPVRFERNTDAPHARGHATRRSAILVPARSSRKFPRLSADCREELTFLMRDYGFRLERTHHSNLRQSFSFSCSRSR